MKKKGSRDGATAYAPPLMENPSDLQREAERLLTRRAASGKVDPDVSAFEALLEKHKDDIGALKKLAAVFSYYQTMLSKIPYRR